MSIPFARYRRAPSRSGAAARSRLRTGARATPAVLALGALVPGVVDAEPEVRRVDGEYLAIVVEAEDNDAADERWVLTEPDTAPTEETTPDPDGNHSDQAVGQAYLELLPDHRVTHDDVDFPDGTPPYLWGTGRFAPQVSYAVDFPEAGRYHAHARAFSTGTEDNGIHLGLDGEWPDSGNRMQWCSAGQGWTWSSRQRGPTEDTACGYDHTIWIDVPEAGPHEVVFGAREDGFELDRFMLIKDLSGGTRVCRAENADDVSCRDGSIEAVDGFVDVEVGLRVAETEGDGDEGGADPSGADLDVVATVRNDDGRDLATAIVLEVALGEDWTLLSADERCLAEGDVLRCEIDELVPREGTEIALSLDAARSGALELAATVAANEVDDDPENDAASLAWAPPAAELEAALALDASTLEVGDALVASATVANVGEGVAESPSAVLAVPDALEVTGTPAGCTDAAPVVCELDPIAPGGATALEIRLVATSVGVATLELEALAADADPATASALFSVTAPAEEETPEEPPETPTEAEPGVEPVAEKRTSGGSGGGGAGAALLLGLVGAALARARRSGRAPAPRP